MKSDYNSKYVSIQSGFPKLRRPETIICTNPVCRFSFTIPFSTENYFHIQGLVFHNKTTIFGKFTEKQGMETETPGKFLIFSYQMSLKYNVSYNITRNTYYNNLGCENPVVFNLGLFKQ